VSTWNVSFDDYQRANLLWLLEACGYPCKPDGSPSGVSPLTCANTGDWLGEVFIKLGGYNDRPDCSPNRSHEQLRRSVDAKEQAAILAERERILRIVKEAWAEHHDTTDSTESLVDAICGRIRDGSYGR
jgi:hypothetical protein